MSNWRVDAARIHVPQSMELPKCDIWFNIDDSVTMLINGRIFEINLTEKDCGVSTTGKFPNASEFVRKTIATIMCQILIHEQNCNHYVSDFDS